MYGSEPLGAAVYGSLNIVLRAGMSTYRQGVLRGGYYSGYRDAHLYR